MSGTPNGHRDEAPEGRVALRRKRTEDEIVAAAWDLVHEHGLGSLSMRDLGDRVGMKAQSLYSYFASKNDIYDAMFGQAWTLFLAEMKDNLAGLPKAPREAVLAIAEQFYAFSLVSVARYQLMNQHAIPGFTPSEASYAPSVEVMGLLRDTFHGLGITDSADVDLFLALGGGLLDRQLANEPGGDRWLRQLPRVIDMFADDIGLPGPPLRRTS